MDYFLQITFEYLSEASIKKKKKKKLNDSR